MEKRDYRLAAIVYTDIKGFSKMMESHESRTIANLEKHNSAIIQVISDCGGEVIKTIGDAFLAHFSNTLNAVKAGIMIQERMNDLRLTDENFEFHLRIGIHLGDIHFYENDALGEGINIASRLQSICKPDCLCVSGEVYNQISNKLETPIRSIGKVELKNISREIHAYEILGTEESPRAEAEQDSSQKASEDQDDQFDPHPFGNWQNWMGRQSERMSRMSWSMPERMKMGKWPMPERMKMGMNIFGFHGGDEEQSSSFSIFDFGGKNRINKEKYGKRPNKPLELFRDYKRMTDQNAEKLSKAVVKNGIGYASVGVLLLAINVMTGFGMPWFLFPVFGYLPIFATFFARYLSFSDNALDLLAIENVPDKELKPLMEFQDLKKNFIHHTLFSASVMALLWVINLLTTPFPFSNIVLAVLFPLWGAHLAGTFLGMRERFAKIKKVLGEKADYLFPKRKARKKADSSKTSGTGRENDPVILEMEQLREKIFSIIKTKGFKDNEHTRGIEPILERFVSEVRTLRHQSADINTLISEIPVNSFDAELKSLEDKRTASGSEVLRNEYSRSISDLEKNRNSITGLHEQKEMLELKVRSAVNSVKQLHINLARMNSYSANADADKMDILAQKTKELNAYLDDLESSYKELKS